MAIRLRKIEGFGLVALCAARSMPKEGDIYLDDGCHTALSQKFTRDFASEDIDLSKCIDHVEEQLVEIEESNNPNRDWWDKEYGKK